MKFRIPVSPLKSEYAATTDELRQRLIEHAQRRHNSISFSYKKSAGVEVSEFLTYNEQEDMLINSADGQPYDWRRLQNNASGQFYG